MEVAYRDGVRYCRKLHPSTQHIIGPVCLQMDTRGKLQHMQVVPQHPRTPALALEGKGNHIKLRVCAVGLNFKDILNVLMPDEAAYVGEVPQRAHICQADPRSYPKKGRPGDDAKLCT